MRPRRGGIAPELTRSVGGTYRPAVRMRGRRVAEHAAQQSWLAPSSTTSVTANGYAVARVRAAASAKIRGRIASLTVDRGSRSRRTR